jgi:hypothetical protein
MEKTNFLPGIALLIGVFIISCDKENPLSHSDCKNFNLKATTESCDWGSDSSCVCFNYNVQDKRLILNHINAAFNCCPGEIYCDIKIKGDTIFLKEKEEKAMCDCGCLYDVDIIVSDIERHKYVINLNEPYSGDQGKIVFEIDLTSNETGVFCVERKQYPWGI